MQKIAISQKFGQNVRSLRRAVNKKVTRRQKSDRSQKRLQIYIKLSQHTSHFLHKGKTLLQFIAVIWNQTFALAYFSIRKI